MDMQAPMGWVRQRAEPGRRGVCRPIHFRRILHGQDHGHGAEPQERRVAMALQQLRRRNGSVVKEPIGRFQQGAVAPTRLGQRGAGPLGEDGGQFDQRWVRRRSPSATTSSMPERYQM